jgi:hypothetical protein
MADGGVTWEQAAAKETPATVSASRPVSPHGAVRRQQGLRPSAVAVPDSTLGLAPLRKMFTKAFRNKRPSVVAAAPPGPVGPVGPVGIVTETVVTAPGQTPDSRTTVGVGERVRMTPSVASDWDADNGYFSGDLGNARSVIWTAPDSAGTYRVRAIPDNLEEATQGEVTMEVIGPQFIRLTRLKDRTYQDDYAGSGFNAAITIEPTDVSFSGMEIREEGAVASTDGYYDDYMAGAEHKQGNWNRPERANEILIDKVGAKRPGLPPPFRVGHFRWVIPLHYRTRGDDEAGTPFDFSIQTQEMTGDDGTETTKKKDATRTRTPTPAPQATQAQEGPVPGPREPQAEDGGDQPALLIGRITKTRRDG